MIVDIPQGTDKRKGTWQRLLLHTPEPEYKPYWSAVVWCPHCGRGLLASQHTISDDGQISPSLGHPTDYPPCDWHTLPRLLDWKPHEWQLPPQPKLNVCALCEKESHQIAGWGAWSGHGLICGDCFKARHSKELPHAQ